MGVGVFTKDYRTAHGAVATMAFFFAGLSAIASSKVLKKPLSLISIILGTITLGALALFSSGMITSGSLTSDIAYDSDFYLGLGPGGMEHMIVYPALMWLAGFSWHLVTQRET
jgi:mannitol-specific phosphotransferase system IIBC component